MLKAVHYRGSCLPRLRLFPLLGCLFIVVATTPFYHPPVPQKTNGSGEGVILVTGFEPFGGLRVNSSWEVVRQLDGQLFNGKRVVVLRLPVVWEAAGRLIEEAIARYQPELVISVGQGLHFLELDAQAQNVNEYIADNLGARPKSLLISTDGRMAYKTSLDLKPISTALKVAEFSHVISPDSGTFLCNFVSYRTFEYLAKVDPDIPVMFVHVLPLASLATLGEQTQMWHLVRALTIIVDAANQQVTEETAPNWEQD